MRKTCWGPLSVGGFWSVNGVLLKKKSQSFPWGPLELAAGRWAVTASNAFKRPNVPTLFDKVICKYLLIWREKKSNYINPCPPHASSQRTLLFSELLYTRKIWKANKKIA